MVTSGIHRLVYFLKAFHTHVVLFQILKICEKIWLDCIIGLNRD